MIPTVLSICADKRGMRESHMKTFMASLHKMKEDDVMTDVTLKLPDGSAVSCHKIVLMASSPFFETMFQSGLKESTEQDVRLDFADADTIRMLLDFFYSGEIDINENNARIIASASEFLCMEDLKDECDSSLATLVNSSNYVELGRFGKKYNLAMLTAKSQDYILANFEEIVKTSSEFKTFTVNELAELLSNDKLMADNEDLVFESVIRWVNFEPDERKEAFTRIAPLIRFPFCSQATLNNIIPQEPLMWNSECMHLLSEAQNYRMNRQRYFHSKRTTPRSAFGGMTERLVRLYQKTHHTIQCDYAECTEGDAWHWNVLLSGRYYLSHIRLSPSGLIWKHNDGISCTLTLTIPHQKIYEARWGTHENTSEYSSWKYICFDETMFAFGWEKSLNEMSTKVESFRLKRYSLNLGHSWKWKTEGSMLYAISDPTLVQFSNRIYILCGRDANGPSALTQEFDPVKCEWKLRSPMPGLCESGAAVALNDKIYVVGGKERACFSYQPATDHWAVLSQTEYAYDKGSATAWKGRILIMGREHAEQYDIEKDCWLPMNKLVPDSMYNASAPADNFFLCNILVSCNINDTQQIVWRA